LAACRSQVRFRTPYLDNDLVSLAYRAPANLRTSSLFALRLIQRSDRALAQIPTDMGYGGTGGIQRGLRCLYSKATFKLDYLSNEALPRWLSPLDPVLDSMNSRKLLLGHHKYLRYRSWLRKELAEYLSDSLADRVILQSSLWDRRFVSRMAERHISGLGNYVREINAVLTLAAVDRLLLCADYEAELPSRRVLESGSGVTDASPDA
jgi:asparagine synthase (glutamine-hydrolysing)